MTTNAPSIAEVHAKLTAPGELLEMAEVVIRGVPTRVWKNAPPSLAAVLTFSRGHGDADFMVYEDDRWSFERHFRACARLANVLIDRYGIKKGDRVAIAMRNFPEWSVAFWAASAAGAIVVPLNAWWTGPELVYGLDDSGSTVLFADAERLDRLVPELAQLPGLRIISARDERDVLPGGAEHFNDVLGEIPDDASLPDVAIDSEDDATIFYTSGTTGHPKGVLGTQRNICGNLFSLRFANMRAAMRGSVTGAKPAAAGQGVYLLSVPFFHATGCHSILVANLAAGNRLVIMHKWDAGRALELIEREKVATFGGVPAMVWQVLTHPDFATRDLSSVRSIGYGGAPAAPELVRKIEEMFPGRTPSNGYGMTETSSVTTLNMGVDYIRHPDSVGVPVPVCDVKVVDDVGRTLPAGEVGELWIKGPNVVKEYFHKPEASAATFTDGWVHTGDLARIDDEGFVYLVDRAKDLLIRAGENISSAEVEAALFEHPSIDDAAVIGIPDQVLGEEVGAVVHLAPGTSATEDELKAWVAKRLAGFKVPRKVWFFDEPLPRNPAGKILKRDLKKQLLGV
ncbi:MAG TPA: class I adenylate-forming enzyme family protein [Candidatus Limnocylindrales bacterium]|nr:class I adenylate-forming enzyme family protein [Candidatus Limnocylindrales bacterium]